MVIFATLNGFLNSSLNYATRTMYLFFVSMKCKFIGIMVLGTPKFHNAYKRTDRLIAILPLPFKPISICALII